MFATLIGNWGIRLVGSYLIGMRLGLGLARVWIAMAADEMGRGFPMLSRFLRGRWKDIQIMHPGRRTSRRGLSHRARRKMVTIGHRSSIQQEGDIGACAET